MAEKMFLETVESEGLSHLSYMIGHRGMAAVVDPRRDVDVYVRLARRRQARIAAIFETHRNEDYIIGSQELHRLTGAPIYHGQGTEWGYGNEVGEGDEFDFGGVRLRVLRTPGHTFDSISLELIDTGSADEPVAVFTGDTLMVGDTGRADLFPQRAEEVAGLLYDSVFGKLLPLGDHVILLPAHGAGSVCGIGMAARDFSTLGMERKHNRSLQARGREEFVGRKIAEHHYKPPYFARMEECNQFGSAPLLSDLQVPRAMNAKAFADAIAGGAVVLDTRSAAEFGGAFVPGSLNIPLDMLPAYAGYLLPYDRDLLLVLECPRDLRVAVNHLRRIGYDCISGYLRDGMNTWASGGKSFDSLQQLSAEALRDELAGTRAPLVLDVRKDTEFQAGHVPGAANVFLGELANRLKDVPSDRPVVTFCGSGQRASVAASVLRRAGFDNVRNALGSMAAWKAIKGEVVREGQPAAVG